MYTCSVPSENLTDTIIITVIGSLSHIGVHEQFDRDEISDTTIRHGCGWQCGLVNMAHAVSISEASTENRVRRRL